MPHRRAGRLAPALLAGLLAAGSAAALVGAAPAAADVASLTDEEVCNLIPAYEGGYGAGSYEPGGTPHAYSIASCSYEVFLSSGYLSLHVQLFGEWGAGPPSAETARETFDVEVGSLTSREGNPGESLDFGDAGRHWVRMHEDGQSYEANTLVLVGPFIIHATSVDFDPTALVREVAAAAALIPVITSTTTTTAVSASTSTTTTEPPEPEEPEPAACAPQGTVTDQAGAPMPGLRVQLWLSGEVADQRVTDEDGWYQFADLGYLAEAFGFDLAEDGYVVGVALRDAVEGSPRFEIRYGPNGVLPEVRKGPRTIEADPTCRVDFAFADIGDEYAVAAGPASPEEWRSLALAYQSIRKAYLFAAYSLGSPLRTTPLPVYMYCQGNPPGVYGSPCGPRAFWRGPVSYDEEPEGSPFLAFPVADSRAWNAGWRPGNGEYHEFGHALMADAFGGFLPSVPDSTNHAGYSNPTSTDSWTEGFAVWFATQVNRTVDGAGRWWLYPEKGQTPNLEDDRRVTDNGGRDEELAIAGILVDMVDGDTDYAASARARLTVVRMADRPDPSHPAGGAVAVEIRNDTGVEQRGIAVSGDFGDAGGGFSGRVDGLVQPDVLAPGASGWAFIPYHQGTGWGDLRSVRVVGLGTGDDDGVTRTVEEVWQAVLAYESTSQFSKGHVMNTAELHQALRNAFPTDLDAIDAVFVAHGVFADTGPRNSQFDPGETIGITSPDGSRLRSDYEAPEVFEAAIDTAGVPARVLVQVLYPEPRDALSYAYTAVPDPDTGTISVAVPPARTGGLVRMVVWADGRLPVLLPDLYAEDFWAQADANGYQPFLDYRATLGYGDLMADAVAVGSDGTPLRGGGFVVPLLAALAAVAAAGGAFWWWRRRVVVVSAPGGVASVPVAPSAPGDPSWPATHVAPASGLAGWGEPDGATPRVAAFGGGTGLQVVERRADWALVRSADGTEAWVDGRRLTPVAVASELPPPPPPPPAVAEEALAAESAAPAEAPSSAPAAGGEKRAAGSRPVASRVGLVPMVAVAALAVGAFLPWRANWEPSSFGTSATLLWNTDADVGWFSIGLVTLLLGLAAAATLLLDRARRYRRIIGAVAAGLALLWLVQTVRYLLWFDFWGRLGAIFTQEFAVGPWLALVAGLVLFLKRD